MEPTTEEYVFVVITKKFDGIETRITTQKPAVSVDEAIEFLLKYKSEQTPQLI